MITDALTRTGQDGGFTTAGLVAALESAWAAIQARHPQVPTVVIVVGSGSPARPNGRLMFGHFAALQWQHGTARMPEVLVSGEGLNRPASDVLATLLHEAAHGLADVRGVKDTSRQGRWHNKAFATLAAELGLAVSKDDKIGWSPTQLLPATADLYTDVLGELAAAMRAYRHLDSHGGTSRRNSHNGHSLSCSCPRRIRASVSTVAEGPILCGVCDREFTADDTEGDQP